MCIIIAKNKSNRLPTKEELQQCFSRNNDGAGFMYVNKNNNVVIDKGYMTYKDFEKRYNKLLRKYNNFDNKSLVIHFRIGTSGTNSAKNTHPYPITNIQDDLHKSYFACKLGVAHNGIISDYTPNKYLNNTNDTNDTQEFIKHYLTPLKENFKNFYKNNDMKKAIEYLTNSKFAILNDKEELELIGNFIEDNNLNFSNGTYKKFEYKQTNNNYNYSYSSWDDYYYTHNFNAEKDDKKEDDTLYLEKLEPTDIYETKSGDFYDVGNKNLYINPYTNNLYMYNYTTKKYSFFANNVTIYDKNYMEIY